jgi:DNA polymerase-3 subunit alpha
LIKVGALSSFGSRAALLFKADELRVKVAKPHSLAGQEGLFSSQDIEKSESVHKLDEVSTAVSEFSQDELQTLERQLLGFSLSAKPVGELLGPLSHEATHKIFEISPHETYGENVRVAAVVTDVKIIVTKNSGQEMAFVRVEDDTGSIELVVFPKLFKATRNYWVDYKPLLISGRVDSREETPALIVEAIDSSESVRAKQNEVFIRVPANSSPDKLKTLKSLLLESPGDSSVILVFEGKKERIKLPLKIGWSETLARKISLIFDTTEAS